MRKLILAAVLFIGQMGTAQVSLKEFMRTESEVEAYAHYFDNRPEFVEEKLDSLRGVYLWELHREGYHPSKKSEAWLTKALDERCRIIRRQYRIIGKDEKKTTFHHDVNIN